MINFKFEKKCGCGWRMERYSWCFEHWVESGEWEKIVHDCEITGEIKAIEYKWIGIIPSEKG